MQLGRKNPLTYTGIQTLLENTSFLVNSYMEAMQNHSLKLAEGSAEPFQASLTQNAHIIRCLLWGAGPNFLDAGTLRGP